MPNGTAVTSTALFNVRLHRFVGRLLAMSCPLRPAGCCGANLKSGLRILLATVTMRRIRMVVEALANEIQ